MLELRILGPLEVCWDGRPLRLPGVASRQVLALLVLRSGTWMTADRLIDELWQNQPPASARKAVQMHVSRLRRALGSRAFILASGPAGYRLEISPEQVDAVRFERLVKDAENALGGSEPERARALFVEALGLWRGAPLAELSVDGALAAEVARLEELRLVALEQRIEADLQLGRHVDLIGELRGMGERLRMFPARAAPPFASTQQSRRPPRRCSFSSKGEASDT
jgi:DNA-binding SARP family transcriptional activator